MDKKMEELNTNGFYSRVGGRQDGLGIDLYRAQKDAEDLYIAGAKRVVFELSNGDVLEWLDPFFGMICEYGRPENGFITVKSLSDKYLSIIDQWIIE